MKFWIRIVVAIAVIVVIGVGVWAFFFKESEEVQAYNLSTQLVDFKESLGVKGKLNNLNDLDYYGNEPTDIFVEGGDYVNTIINLRKLCLSKEVINQYDSTGTIIENTYESYYTTDLYVDQIFEYLLPFTKSSRVHSSSLKSLKKSINNYTKSLEELNYSIDSVVDVQKKIDGTNTSFGVLAQQYRSMKDQYEIVLRNASVVIIDMLNYINKSTYSGKFLMDTNTALYDSFARALNACSICKEEEEYLYAGDLYFVVDKINKVNNGDDIYNEKYSEYDFLSAYNVLFRNYQGTIDYVYSTVSVEKKQMSANTNLSKIVETAQPYVVTMLNVLGF